MIEHLCPEPLVMSAEKRENFCPGNFPNYLEAYMVRRGGGGNYNMHNPPSQYGMKNNEILCDRPLQPLAV